MSQHLHSQKPDAPWRARAGELLYEFLHGHARIRCVRRDHGGCGVEAQILHDALIIGRTFHQWLGPTRTPHEMAIVWAEAERAAIEKGGHSGARSETRRMVLDPA